MYIHWLLYKHKEQPATLAIYFSVEFFCANKTYYGIPLYRFIFPMDFPMYPSTWWLCSYSKKNHLSFLYISLSLYFPFSFSDVSGVFLCDVHLSCNNLKKKKEKSDPRLIAFCNHCLVVLWSFFEKDPPGPPPFVKVKEKTVFLYNVSINWTNISVFSLIFQLSTLCTTI